MKKLLIPIIGLAAAVVIGAGVGIAVVGGPTNAPNPGTAQQATQTTKTPAIGQMRIKGGTHTPQCTVVNGVKQCKPINW